VGQLLSPIGYPRHVRPLTAERGCGVRSASEIVGPQVVNQLMSHPDAGFPHLPSTAPEGSQRQVTQALTMPCGSMTYFLAAAPVELLVALRCLEADGHSVDRLGDLGLQPLPPAGLCRRRPCCLPVAYSSSTSSRTSAIDCTAELGCEHLKFAVTPLDSPSSRMRIFVNEILRPTQRGSQGSRGTPTPEESRSRLLLPDPMEAVS
jgi:hypothetical protein